MTAPPGCRLTGGSDNPNTLLGQADLVFVNPVGTAFSRPDQPGRGPNFWNTAADIASLGEFVRSFINHQQSPEFAALSGGRGFRHGAGGGFGRLSHRTPDPGARRGAALDDDERRRRWPAMRSTSRCCRAWSMAAWHHKKLAPELNAMSAEQISGQARQFASREYLHALYKGDRMTPEERTKAVADLSRLTGLSKAFIVNNDLRITLERFNSELLRDQHRGLSNSDARVTGFRAGSGRRRARWRRRRLWRSRAPPDRLQPEQSRRRLRRPPTRPTCGTSLPSTATATESSTCRAAASAPSPPPGATMRASPAPSPATPTCAFSWA